LFTVFKKHHINTLQAIVVNYLVAFSFAYWQSEVNYNFVEIPHQKWFFATVILGVLFISLFNLMAKTTQYLGVSVAAISGKMSMVIPVLFGILVYKEPVNLLKIIAIILALFAVYLTSVKGEKEVNLKLIYLPIILFFGSGFLDTLLKYFEKHFVNENEVSIFIGTVFFNAMLIGSILLLFNKKKNKPFIEIKSFLGGIILGIFNYYAMFFLVRSLQTVGKLDSSKVFTLNNIGIVLLSAFFGLILFKEKFNRKNIIGIVFAVISVYLLLISY
jgi:drug/metabolite transporter (DMT)-like permease